VPEQRLLSPEICLRWRRRCITILGKMPIDLGFSSEGSLYAERQRQRATRGASPPPGTAMRGLCHPLVSLPSGPPPALFRSLSFVREK
jgi:hypothetical protein